MAATTTATKTRKTDPPRTPPGVLARPRSDGSWYFQVKWRAGGRRDGEWCSVSLDTKTDASDFHVALKANGYHHPDQYRVVDGRLIAVEDVPMRRRRQGRTTGPTLDDLFEDMRVAKRRAKTYKKGSRRLDEMASDWANHVAPVFGAMSPLDIDEDAVQDWVDDLDTRYAAASVRKYWQLLCMAYEHGLRDRDKWRSVRFNPAVGAALESLPKGSRRGIDPNNWQFLHSAAQEIDADAADLLLFAVGTGWRWSEIAALQVSQVIELGDRLLVEMSRVIRRSVAGSVTVVENDGKSSAADRTIALSPVVAGMVRRRIAERRPAEHLFTAPEGGQLRYDNFRRRAWLPIVARAQELGMTQVPTLHWLRHTQATWMLRTEATAPLGVTRRLGHSNESTTHRYQSAYDDVPTAALVAFDQFLSPENIIALDGRRKQKA